MRHRHLEVTLVQRRSSRSSPAKKIRPDRCGGGTLVALVLGCYLVTAGQRPKRWEDVREFRLGVLVEDGELVRLQSGDVLVQRVDEDRERQVALEFGCRSRENDVTASLGASGKFPQEPRVADPRLARQLIRSGAASIQLVQELLDRTEFVGPAVPSR